MAIHRRSTRSTSWNGVSKRANFSHEEDWARVRIKLKSQLCERRFDVDCLDDDDREERYRPGSPVRWPECHSRFVEIVRKFQRTA